MKSLLSWDAGRMEERPDQGGYRLFAPVPAGILPFPEPFESLGTNFFAALFPLSVPPRLLVRATTSEAVLEAGSYAVSRIGISPAAQTKGVFTLALPTLMASYERTFFLDNGFPGAPNAMESLPEDETLVLLIPECECSLSQLSAPAFCTWFEQRCSKRPVVYLLAPPRRGERGLFPDMDGEYIGEFSESLIEHLCFFGRVDPNVVFQVEAPSLSLYSKILADHATGRGHPLARADAEEILTRITKRGYPLGLNTIRRYYGVAEKTLQPGEPLNPSSFFRFSAKPALKSNAAASAYSTAAVLKFKEALNRELTGQDAAVTAAIKAVTSIVADRRRRAMGLPTADSSMVMVFSGPPGTGKTTLAKLLGQAFKELGLVPAGEELFCATGASLKAPYLGQTAGLVRNLFHNHKILLIDEAYSLVTPGGGSDSYAEEALGELMVQLEEHRSDSLVVFAGYSDKMDEFMEANPGLRSRVGAIIPFTAYSADVMQKILRNMLKDKNLELASTAPALLQSFCAKLAMVAPERRGGARTLRSLVERALAAQAYRLVMAKGPGTQEDLTLLTEEDVATAIGEVLGALAPRGAETPIRSIGFQAL